jgi:hypothetical protein
VTAHVGQRVTGAAPVLGTGAVAASLGALLVHSPRLGLGLGLGIVLAIVLLLSLEVEQLVLGAVGLALFARLLLPLGAPSFLVYAHYAVALCALVKLAEGQLPRIAPTLFRTGIGGLSAVVVVSAAAGGWHALRPAFFWLSIVEPFLLLALLAGQPAALRARVRRWLILFATVQIPFAVVQFALHGWGDGVRGTLLGDGAGAHILGAVALVGGVLVATDSTPGRRRSWRYLLAGALFALPVLADAKQVYAVLVLAGLPFVLFAALGGRGRVLQLGIFVALAVAIGSQVYTPLGGIVNVGRAEQSSHEKSDAVRYVLHRIGWSGSAIGVGPGNGVSRVALTTTPGYGHVPHAVLGGGPAALATDVVQRNNQRDHSSVDSAFSSWLGLFSDVGLAGIAAYLLLGLWAVRSLAGAPPTERALGRFLLLYAAVLGVAFTWLEEPEFTLFLAAAVGVLAAGRDRGRATEAQA